MPQEPGTGSTSIDFYLFNGPRKKVRICGHPTDRRSLRESLHGFCSPLREAGLFYKTANGPSLGPSLKASLCFWSDLCIPTAAWFGWGMQLGPHRDLRPTSLLDGHVSTSQVCREPSSLCSVVIKASSWVWVEGSGFFLFCDLKNEFPVGFPGPWEGEWGKKAAETEVRVFTNNQIPMILKPYTVGARRSLKDQIAKPSGFEVEESETRKD